MRSGRLVSALVVAALLSACGGDDGGGGSAPVATNPTPTPTPAPTPTTTAGCTLRERETWAAAQLNEWYLFPETLPASLDPTPYKTLSDYVDGLTATARAQGHDRYFTYVTSIAEENAYFSSGTSAGLGVRLALDSTGKRLFIAEAFEGAPALTAGLDRGTEILAIGTSSANLQTVTSIYTAKGQAGLVDALGPDDAGVARVLRVNDAGGTRNVTVTKTSYDIAAVSTRYGSSVINDAGHKVGYVNLRTFITSAENQLRTAFATFRAQGITEVIVDLRYNGGGLVSTAQVLGNLLGGNRSTADVFAYQTFRPEKSVENETMLFAPQPESVSPTKIAFIGTGGTASASELVINAFPPYLHANAALIGTNTYGKPVGQIALDRAACDDRLRVIAFATQNSAHNANYYNGLASTMEASCAASDDLTHKFGDPQESSIRRSLDYLEGKSCTRVSATASTATASAPGALKVATPAVQTLVTPDRPSPAQREVPGLF
ncbi:peptidase S41 [Sphingomonas populi]|uniref:Peptidase S41 n=1 Tax=Sphingomonas populi TaxID=2484750 RepID=A0A4Q6XTU1_9SPHN|nr:S41 family peptidase [Sphingomonas populi]RZF63295.1 peptidase S41 [Sphingomonas populi]